MEKINCFAASTHFENNVSTSSVFSIKQFCGVQLRTNFHLSSIVTETCAIINSKIQQIGKKKGIKNAINHMHVCVCERKKGAKPSFA